MEIINFKKKKMNFLTEEHQYSYKNAKICCICKEKFEDNHAKDKNYRKVRNNCHYTGEDRCVAHDMYSLKYNVPKEIPIVFYNGSNCN